MAFSKIGEGSERLLGNAPDELKPTLGALDLTLIGIGASIGSGIFVLSGVALREAGPGVWLSFVVAAAVCMLDAVCYAELASRFPRSGGAYLFTKNVFGNPSALIVGLNLLFDYHIGAAAIARSFAGYLSNILETIPSVSSEQVAPVEAIPVAGIFSLNLVAPVLLAFLTAVLCRGVSESASLNRLLTGTKIVTILVVIVAGATCVDRSLWTPSFPEGFGPVASETATLFFAYVGFDAVANSAEECERPGRDIPVAIVGSLAACAGLYVGVVVVLAGLVSYQDLDETAPLAAAFDEHRGMGWARDVVDAGGLIGLSTTLLIGLYAQSRVYLGMARDGALPAWLAQVHPTYLSPFNAQLLCGAVAMTLATLFDVHMLASLLSIGVMSSYTAVAASTLSLRAVHKRRTHAASAAAVALSAATGLALRLGAPLWPACAPLAALSLATLAPLVLALPPPSPAAGPGAQAADPRPLLPKAAPPPPPPQQAPLEPPSAEGGTAWSKWARRVHAAYPPPLQKVGLLAHNDAAATSGTPPNGHNGRNTGNSGAAGGDDDDGTHRSINTSHSQSGSGETKDDHDEGGGGGGGECDGGGSRGNNHRAQERVVFACPTVPFVPWLALCCNAGLMAQLPWEAWVRLGVVTSGVLGFRWWSGRRRAPRGEVIQV